MVLIIVVVLLVMVALISEKKKNTNGRSPHGSLLWCSELVKKGYIVAHSNVESLVWTVQQTG